MKRKSLTYLMLIIVLGIWGKVGFDFFCDNGTEETLIDHSSMEISLPSFDNESPFFQPNFKFRDVFLDQGRPVSSKRAKGVKVEPSEVAPQIQWPELDYLGLMVNRKAQISTAILRVNGREELLSLGECIEGLAMKQVARDSVTLSFCHETRTYHK